MLLMKHELEKNVSNPFSWDIVYTRSKCLYDRWY